MGRHESHTHTADCGGPSTANAGSANGFRPEPQLDEAVRRILASYDEHGGINHIEGRNLPSKDGIVALVSDLERILFPGYYGDEPINARNLPYVIGALCASVYERLAREIEKSLRHECRRDECCANEAEALCARQAREVTVAFLEELPRIREVLKLDADAHYAGDPAARSLPEVLLSYPGLHAIGVHRMAHFLWDAGVPLIPRMMAEHVHGRTGIDIHPGARIGPGFFIDHGTGVVIGETSLIGKNVKIYQGVTLGALSVKKKELAPGEIDKRHPTLEDGVTIYAGATILGGDTVVGAGSVIGGNVWLTRSVAPGTKVMVEAPFQVFRSRREDGSVGTDTSKLEYTPDWEI